MTIRLTAFLEFATLADARDAYAQLLARAQQARVVATDGVIERTSFARVDNNGLDRMFHLDEFGIVREGEYATRKPGTYPLWVQPTGAFDSYPILDAAGNPTRVEHEGRNYENTAGTVNSWAPGVFGWTDIGPAE